MAIVKYHKTKDSTITIGSTDEKSAIISDITISGGEKDQVEIDAIDGSQYSFAGSAGKVTVEFDFVQGETYNITEMVYGPETTSGDTVLHTLNWDGDGEVKTITLANVRSADSQTYTLTLTDVEGISAPITFTKGEMIVRTFTGTVAASDVAETLLEGS